MSASLTAAVLSTTQALAGMLWTVQITKTGGTAYTVADGVTGTPFTVANAFNASTNPLGNIIVNQNCSSATVCNVTVRAHNLSAGVTFTDSLDNVSVTIPIGTTQPTPRLSNVSNWVYVSGGVDNPAAPILSVTGSKGSAVYAYQVVGKTGGGATTACRQIISNSPTNGFNEPASLSANNASGSLVAWSSTAVNFAPGTTTICNAPDTLNGSNYVTVTFPTIPAVNGVSIATYDVIRARLNNGSIGTLSWYAVATGLTYAGNGSNGQISYQDTGTVSGSAYTLTANTTSLGNDSTGNGSSGAPYATLTKAMSVCSANAGYGIQVSGVSYDVGQNLNCVAGVLVTGASGDATVDILNGTPSSGSGVNAAYRLATGMDFVNLGFKTDASGQIILGAMTTDSNVFTDVRFFNCSARGWTNVFRAASAGGPCAADFYNCDLVSSHGMFGCLLNGNVFNLINCTLTATGGFYRTGTGTLPIQLNGGFVNMWSVTLQARSDSQDPTNWIAAGVFAVANANISGLTMQNCTMIGSQMDIYFPTPANVSAVTGFWLGNTKLSGSRNQAAVTVLGAKLTNYSQGANLPGPFAGTAAASGGASIPGLPI